MVYYRVELKLPISQSNIHILPLKIFVAATRQGECEVAQKMKTDFLPLRLDSGRYVQYAAKNDVSSM